MAGRNKVSALKSPYYSNHIGDASFTVGVEGSNAINVAIQLKSTSNADLATRGALKMWLSSDANGDNQILPHLMPAGGYAIGTDGTIINDQAFRSCVLVKGTIVIDAVPEKFKTTTIAYYRIGGAQYTKAATTAIVFTAAHVINASTFGVVLIQINAAGTVSTKVPLATQLYASAALARAALPAPDAGNVVLGWIEIANNAGDWTANTDDLTNASDVTTAAFVDASEVGSYGPAFEVLSEADGDIDITFSETGVRGTFYLHGLLPDGSKVSSGAITFA